MPPRLPYFLTAGALVLIAAIVRRRARQHHAPPPPPESDHVSVRQCGDCGRFNWPGAMQCTNCGSELAVARVSSSSS
jgi:hypothetical protein